MAEIKINYTIAIEGNVYLLCPKNNGEYYEVYTHSNDDMYGKYLGDFESTNRVETLVFEREFTAWLKGENYTAGNNVEDALYQLMCEKCTAMHNESTKCYKSGMCLCNCPYFVVAVNQLKNK